MLHLVILLAALVAGPALAQPNDFVVIVHKDNPQSTLTKQQVGNFLLKKSSRWESGTQAEPVDLESSSETRKEFSMAIHGRAVPSIKNYWQRQIFAGRSVPPPELATDQEVVAFVRSRPGGIGYVSSNASIGDGVIVVTVSDE